MIFFLLLTLLLSACSPTQKPVKQDKTDLDSIQTEIIKTKIVETEPKEEPLRYWYIYSNGNHKQPSDSLGWYRSDYEKSLALYNDVDNLSKTVHNIGLHVSIFKLENEKFAFVIDSTTKIYKFIEGNYKQIISTNSAFAFGTNVKIEQKRLNLDKFKDVLVEIPSGGMGGSEFLFLFYNPTTKSFDYDYETELRNIEFDIKKQKVVSHYQWSKATFVLENNKSNLLFKI
ncbi:hypothetical protein [Bernardetia sp. MNP-M8]|uniref:hypothetical protein n=1 Tax=Bernardetia sp. MNP-M8 TaxID=3127470 RepID=UPI0030CECCC4